MKNLNKISNSLLIVYIVSVLAFSSPLATFAQDKNDNGDKVNAKAYGHLIAPGYANKNTDKGGSSSSSSASSWWNNLPWGIGQHLFGFNNNKNNSNRGDHDNDADDNSSTTSDKSGTPIINSITSPTVLSVDQTGTWSVQASDSLNNPLNYSVDWGDQQPRFFSALFSSQTSFVQTSTFTHSYSNAGTYTIHFTVRDTVSSKETKSTVNVQVNDSVTSTTTNPLVLSGLNSTAQINQAEISWNTNIPANSKIWHGTTTPVNTTGSSILSSNNLVYNHYFLINNLTASTTYYYVVTSQDSTENVATSSELSFTTNASAYVNPLLISSAIAIVDSTSVHLTWNTNLLADSEVYYSTTSPVTIGTTSVMAVTDSTLVTNHSLNVTDLATSTTYYFVIQSKNTVGDTVSTKQFSVTTGI